ncbi:hypothetical protein NLG97_g3102 [Lecanicillium saksenae]|uniref:Uncharacterized protein n=1 Tax=Lecanicillium saksenae TaxID=468837 RepID=A0ACC1R314_9HYPO|nr:hypothetical protein NLG97_g3102 [Lecanicillium saksenae]
MHVAFLTNPASGQVNVQFATAQKLVSDGHRVTFLSAESCRPKVARFRQSQPSDQRALVDFVSFGSAQIIEDYTKLAQIELATMRGPPGSIASLETGINGAFGPVDVYMAMILEVHDTIEHLDPDIICVDCFSSPYMHGARLTKRKYVVTIPCSPGLTAKRGTFIPHPIAARRDRSWMALFENTILCAHEFIHSRTDTRRREKSRLLRKQFQFNSLGRSADTWILPPYWKDENCVAGIHFNTLGLADCPEQPSKLAFVGAGLCPDFSPPSADVDKDLLWMDEAADLKEAVVYMNMGSMFIWKQDEYRNCMQAFIKLHKRLGGCVRFLVKMNKPCAAVKDSSVNFNRGDDELPDFIRLTTWINNQAKIYSHDALKVFIHHGGGNSFNEAVHHAVPQLVLSQWFDTHEYGYSAEKFGLGFRSRRPPIIEAGDVEAKLFTMLSPRWGEFKRNCMAWAIRSKIGGGADAAAAILLAHADDCRNVLPSPELSLKNGLVF